MRHYSSLYIPPVVQGTKRWACWAFMQSLWDNGIEPSSAMLESFLRNMWYTVIQQLPAPEKPN